MSRWIRVTRSKPCPICKRPDYCGVAADGSAAICMRTKSPKPTRNGGWLHRLGSGETGHSRCRVVHVPTRAASDIDCAKLAADYSAAVRPDDLDRLAVQLGVMVESLRRLGIGWDGEAWTFPMQDARGAIVGIRRRLPVGRKLAVKGGREGCFVPAGLGSDGAVCICEGPTDSAVLLDLGFDAIGRPSCTGGKQIVVELVRGREAMIVADADEPGKRGAEALAPMLLVYCPSVRIIAPPDGVKDARAWRQAGATSEDVNLAIMAATPIRLSIRREARP